MSFIGVSYKNMDEGLLVGEEIPKAAATPKAHSSMGELTKAGNPGHTFTQRSSIALGVSFPAASLSSSRQLG